MADLVNKSKWIGGFAYPYSPASFGQVALIPFACLGLLFACLKTHSHQDVNMFKSCLEALPRRGSHVARLNFKTSCVCVYKCLSLSFGFAVTVAIWLREVVSCCDFILLAVVTFWAMSLVGIYPGRASVYKLNMV